MTDGRRWAITLLVLVGAGAILSAFVEQPVAVLTAMIVAGVTFLALPANRKAGS